MSALDESERLHSRARAFASAFVAGGPPPEPFDALAADLARFQASHVEGYARLCRARGIGPARLSRAAEAPAVPTDAFKVARVFAFDDAAAIATFRTSGTTVGTRGVHRFRDVATYEAAALAFGRPALAQDLPEDAPVLVLGPSRREAPDSSLAHMTSLFAERLGRPAGVFVRAGALDADGLRRTIEALDAPALVLATSFALVHLLDALRGAGLPLPCGGRVMQTGGFKGRSREVEAATLRAEVARTFGVTEARIVSEYGMTELSSQFYDRGDGLHREPPWARVVPVDPVSLEPLPPGEIGIARIEDLMNVDSAFAVLTQDRVRRVGDGFELLGRAPGAPPRGCSIAIDEMLGGLP